MLWANQPDSAPTGRGPERRRTTAVDDRPRRFAILLLEQGLHFAARLAEKYVVMAKGAVKAQDKSTELNADMVQQHLTV